MQIPFLKKEEIAKDTFAFFFDTTDKNLSFSSGQYTTIALPTGNSLDSRDFTIASSPTEKSYIMIVTKNRKSTFKEKLFSLKRGSLVSMKEPSGGFVLDEQKAQPRVFLAGGIGITPFHSMITSIGKRNLIFPITLIASFSKKEDLLFYNTFKKIEKENPMVTIVYSLSQDSWEGEMGRISKKHIQKYNPKIGGTEYLIAGGEEMVTATEQLLLQMGVQAKNIRIDIFTGY